MRKIEVTLLTFLVILSINVSAIGVSPGKIIKYYEPGETGRIEFYAVNSKNAETPIKFGSFGELSEGITISAQEDVLRAGEAKIYFFDYVIPENLLPGDHRTDITITEVRASEDQAGTIGATASVGLIFIVRVPYEGQYLSLDLSATDVNLGETVNFNAKLSSLGEEDISSITGKLKIYDSNNNLIETVDFPETSLLTNEVKDVGLQWNSGSNIEGSYSAVLDLEYGGKFATDETEFKVGIFNIEILGLSQKELSKGKINKVEIITKNQGASTINPVYAEITFLGKTVRTDDFSYGPWEQKSISSYADATDAETGEYVLGTKLNYNGETVEKDFIVKIVDSTNFSLIATVSGIIALVIGIIILYLFRKNHKRDKKKK